MQTGMLIALLRRIKPSKKCRRCALRYPAEAERCPHCTDLDEAELAELKIHIERRHRANAGLGRVFFYISGILVAAIVVMVVAGQ